MQQFGNALVDVALAPPREFERIGDIAKDGARTQQVELLEDHPDVAANFADLLGGQAVQRVAVHGDGAVGGCFESVDQPHQGALARAGEADEREDLTGLDVESDVVEGAHGRLAALEGLADSFEADDGFGHFAAMSFSSRCRILLSSAAGRSMITAVFLVSFFFAARTSGLCQIFTTLA